MSPSSPRAEAPADAVRDENGFRLVHFAVLGDHLHMLCEVDGQKWLARGVQKIALSLARSLNAAAVRDAGGSLDPRAGTMHDRPGWIGPVFAERYHLHMLTTPTEIAHCLEYLFTNAAKHFGTINVVRCKLTESQTRARYIDIDAFTSFAELHTSADPPIAPARGRRLERVLARHPWAIRTA